MQNLIIKKFLKYYRNKEFRSIFCKNLISYTFMALFFLILFIPIPLSYGKVLLINFTIFMGLYFFYINKKEGKKTKDKPFINNLSTIFPQLKTRILNIKIEDKLHLALLILVSFLFLYFGSVHLGQFVTVDEPKWLFTRVPQLYEALSSGNWALTYINDKPGILPSLLAGITNFFLDLNDYGPQELEHYLFWWRFPILFFNFFMLFIIYYFSKKLLDKNYALLITGLIALNPIIIGISQIVNPDATLWSVGLISLLTFFLYLKTNENKYVWYCGIFLGLGLLSKYFINIFYIIFFIIIYYEYLLGKLTHEQFFVRCYNLCKIYLISIILYILLFPANWVDPYQIFLGTFGANILRSGLYYFLIFLFMIFFEIIILKGKISEIVIKKHIINKTLLASFSITFLVFFGFLFYNIAIEYALYQPDHLINLETFQITGEYTFFSALIRSGYVVLFTLVPFHLLALLASPKIFLLKNIKFNMTDSFILISLYLFIIVFLVGSALGGYVAITRYQIILYPFYCLITALIFLKLTRKKMFATILLLSISLLISYQSMPFYYNYNNVLNVHDTVVTDAWGFGGYELAQKTNLLPNAKNITVWSDREGFNEFFIGNAIFRAEVNPFDCDAIDYLVLTRGGKRIFERALNAENTIYYDYIISSDGNILDYYNKKDIISFYVLDNPNNYVRLVEFNK